VAIPPSPAITFIPDPSGKKLERINPVGSPITPPINSNPILLGLFFTCVTDKTS
jgi:hypothetical protein